MMESVPAWQSRTARLLGTDGVQRLADASVAVFGLGGVGSFTVEALARAGVGRLVLVDGDTVAESNLNRQLIATTATLGRYKADAAAERVREIAPACRVEAHRLYYDAKTGQGLIDGCDFVADAVDRVSSKLALVEECYSKNIPLISAMGCGNKLDPSRFRVADIAHTAVCPLCRVMRRELRARGISHLPVVYSDEPPLTPLPVPGEPADARTPGSVSFVPSAAGLLLAGEIVRRLCHKEP